jgi:hypothetical protein
MFTVLLNVGCDKPAENAAPAAKAESAKTPATQPIVPVAQVIDWCKEHGVPESICVQCNESLAAAYKAKGDWCKEHNRPESQCFECHPELRQQFAAAFKKKYGKEPPASDLSDKK